MNQLTINRSRLYLAYIFIANYIYICIMNKTKAYVILCTLAMFCLCISTIEVTFNPNSGKKAFICTVPIGMFRKIDDHKMEPLPPSALEQASSSPKEKCEFSLSYIHTREQYEHFKVFGETDLETLPAEDKALSQYQVDLTPDLFDSFLFAAGFLEIQGEYAKRFAANMVRYGLLGKHTKDITGSSQCQDKNIPYYIFRPMLSAFLKQINFKSRITHSIPGQTRLALEGLYESNSRINEEYTGPPQLELHRTVLYSKFKKLFTKEKERNEVVLSWLLLNMGGSSIDIQYIMGKCYDYEIELKKTLPNLTKENKKGEWVYVEGVTLSVTSKNISSLGLALQFIPDLSRLEVIFSSSIYHSDLSVFFSCLASCKYLNSLKISGISLDGAAISELVENIPNIRQLGVRCKILDSTTIDSLKKCAHLDSLMLFEKSQTNDAVKELVRSLPLLRELSIGCYLLDSTTAECFQACQWLEKLEIYGKYQLSNMVQTLVSHLPPLLKDLEFKCEALEPTVKESFKTCKRLERLNITGVHQPKTACLFKSLEVLSFLLGLKIKIYNATLDWALNLRNFSNLRSLDLTVKKYTPGFLARYLQAPLPRLEYLKLYNMDEYNSYTKEDNMAVKKACAKGITVILED
ncbi:hypothetical protein NECID01_2125 [Nematocida sp. AWRm77]|nr:hypothetical protein NECID01_2125 [Nematocida sp. AWRm77]